MKKGIQNINAVASKLKPALIKTINHRLEKTRKVKQKREEIVKKRKVKAMTIKYYRIIKEIRLSNIEKKNYKSNIKDNINLDKVNNKYPLQL